MLLFYVSRAVYIRRGLLRLSKKASDATIYISLIQLKQPIKQRVVRGNRVINERQLYAGKRVTSERQ